MALTFSLVCTHTHAHIQHVHTYTAYQFYMEGKRSSDCPSCPPLCLSLPPSHRPRNNTIHPAPFLPQSTPAQIIPPTIFFKKNKQTSNALTQTHHTHTHPGRRLVGQLMNGLRDTALECYSLVPLSTTTTTDQDDDSPALLLVDACREMRRLGNVLFAFVRQDVREARNGFLPGPTWRTSSSRPSRHVGVFMGCLSCRFFSFFPSKCRVGPGERQVLARAGMLELYWCDKWRVGVSCVYRWIV